MKWEPDLLENRRCGGKYPLSTVICPNGTLACAADPHLLAAFVRHAWVES